MIQYTNFIGIIENNFLSTEEVSDIKRKVMNYRDIWRFEGHTGFLPHGLYAKDSEEYIALVNKFKNLLEENFSDIYDKIQKKISDLFNSQCSFVSHKHKPGFHIFGPGPLIYDKVNYHIDRFPTVSGKIYSFIIPISLPKTQTGLDYILPNKNLSISDIKRSTSQNSCETLIYNTGCLGMWDGNIIHAIKPFTLDNDEYRITIQFHVAFNTVYPDKSFIFW